MPEAAHQGPGLIGPNAVLQLVAVLQRELSPEQLASILARADIEDLPDGRSMIPEIQAARLHAQMRHHIPHLAPAVASAAGRATADYILAHRIPALVQHVLRALPASLAAPVLSRAIAAHAWTFAGSGQFRLRGSWHFEITRNPLVQGEHSPACLCHWHAAVFTRLYQHLVAGDCQCRETECAAQGAGHRCRFVLARGTSGRTAAPGHAI